ncbi:MAG: branched-chain amino acid ABC transporter permease [Rhizobiaceae bacterium]
MSDAQKSLTLTVCVIVLLLVLHFVLPAYHHGNLARIMVLAVYAMGFNFAFGYGGMLSLGHAMFFGAGMYGMGLVMQHLGWPAGPALIAGLVSSLIVSAVIGFLALRTSGVQLMIVTLMFSQAGFLTVLYFGEWTRGDEGFVIQQADRMLAGIDLSNEANRYLAGLLLFAICLFFLSRLVQSPFGKVLVAIRENEERTRMLGYDVGQYKLIAFIISGTVSGVAGASYGLLFGYVGASFASVQYSILPLLWVLLGGAGTALGPLVGTLFMFYLIDITSGYTTAYLAIAGLVLVLLTLFARHGIIGEVRRRWLKWLP